MLLEVASRFPVLSVKAADEWTVQIQRGMLFLCYVGVRVCGCGRDGVEGGARYTQDCTLVLTHCTIVELTALSQQNISLNTCIEHIIIHMYVQ